MSVDQLVISLTIDQQDELKQLLNLLRDFKREARDAAEAGRGLGGGAGFLTTIESDLEFIKTRVMYLYPGTTGYLPEEIKLNAATVLANFQRIGVDVIAKKLMEKHGLEILKDYEKSGADNIEDAEEMLKKHLGAVMSELDRASIMGTRRDRTLIKHAKKFFNQIPHLEEGLGALHDMFGAVREPLDKLYKYLKGLGIPVEREFKFKPFKDLDEDTKKEIEEALIKTKGDLTAKLEEIGKPEDFEKFMKESLELESPAEGRFLNFAQKIYGDIKSIEDLNQYFLLKVAERKDLDALKLYIIEEILRYLQKGEPKTGFYLLRGWWPWIAKTTKKGIKEIFATIKSADFMSLIPGIEKMLEKTGLKEDAINEIVNKLGDVATIWEVEKIRSTKDSEKLKAILHKFPILTLMFGEARGELEGLFEVLIGRILPEIYKRARPREELEAVIGTTEAGLQTIVKIKELSEIISEIDFSKFTDEQKNLLENRFKSLSDQMQKGFLKVLDAFIEVASGIEKEEMVKVKSAYKEELGL